MVRFIESRRVAKILRELALTDDSDTLEVGCGAGDILARVPKGKLHGFDLSKKMVEVTRRKVNGTAPGRLGTLTVGDAQAWPEAIRTHGYTDIYCSEVIEHIPEPRKLMEQLYAAADERTKAVVVSTPNEPMINSIKRALRAVGLFRLLFPKIAEDMTDEWHLTSFNIPTMRKVSAGLFDIVKIQGAPFDWLPIRYIFTLKKSPERR